MADTKTSALTELTTPALEDLLYIVDDPGGTPASRKATGATVFGEMSGDVPGGRLTLTTATPVTTADVTAATTLYYTPYIHDKIRLYDGTTWNKYVFTERSIAVPASTSQMYDVWLYDNSGTLTLELLAWTNDTTRATALAYQDGVLVKSGATTRRYLGSVRTTTSSGEIDDSLLYRGVWNMYNRVPRMLDFIDTTAHAYTTTSFRAWNNDSTLRVEIVLGQSQIVALNQNSKMYGNSTCITAIDVDGSTTVDGGYVGNENAAAIIADGNRKYNMPVGYHYLQAIERGGTGGNFGFIIISTIILG